MSKDVDMSGGSGRELPAVLLIVERTAAREGSVSL